MDKVFNKRGQLARIITSVPVLILIVVIMAIFLFLSYSISSGGIKVYTADIFPNRNDLLLTPVSISNADSPGVTLVTVEDYNKIGFGEEMSIFEGVLRVAKDEMSEKRLGTSMLSLLDDKDPCYSLYAVYTDGGRLITQGSKYFGQDIDGPARYVNTPISEIVDNLNYNRDRVSVQVKGRTLNIYTYYGDCNSQMYQDNHQFVKVAR